MSRFTYTTITNLSSNPASAQSAINANFAAVQTLVEDFVSRSGAVTNSMTSDLDMNSHKVLNLATPINPTDAVRLEDISSYLTSVTTSQAATAALLEQFETEYLGAANTDPITDLDGNSLINGALYFNSVSHIIRVFNSATSLWQDIFDVAGIITAANVVFVPAGRWVSTNVQAALQEADTKNQPVNAELTAVSAFASTGLISRSGAATYVFRTITQPAAGITVTNGDGTAGNPTLSLANDLSALEGLAGTGIPVRTATDTWTQRAIAGTANQVTVTNGDGVAGAPTISLPTSLTFTGFTITGGTYSSPTFTNPTLGTPASGNLSNCTNYPVAQLTGTGTGILTWLATPSSANLLSAMTTSTGSGLLVFATSPTFTTPILGTPQSGNLSNCSNYPGSALTQVSDTNVTLTLGGSPTTALVNAASITAGWAGQLSIARGGTGNIAGVASFTHAHFGGI